MVTAMVMVLLSFNCAWVKCRVRVDLPLACPLSAVPMSTVPRGSSVPSLSLILSLSVALNCWPGWILLASSVCAREACAGTIRAASLCIAVASTLKAAGRLSKARACAAENAATERIATDKDTFNLLFMRTTSPYASVMQASHLPRLSNSDEVPRGVQGEAFHKESSSSGLGRHGTLHGKPLRALSRERPPLCRTNLVTVGQRDGCNKSHVLVPSFGT